jgi:hypothetical protein
MLQQLESPVTLTKGRQHRPIRLKLLNPLPIFLHMVNPITSNISHASEAAKPAAPKPQLTQQKNSPQPSDTVTLRSTKSAGDVDHDGDTA